MPVEITEEQFASWAAGFAANAEAHETFNRRLNEHSAELSKRAGTLVQIAQISKDITQMRESVKRVEGTLENIDKRVGALEMAPGDNWKKMAFEIVKYIVIAGIGFAASFLYKGLP